MSAADRANRIAARGVAMKMKPSLLVVALLAVPVLAPSAAAQTAASSQACERFVANPARFPEVRSQLQASARGSDGPAHFAKGCLATAVHKWGDAAKAFEKAVDADENNSIAHYWLGRTFATQVLDANVLRQASLARRVRSHFERAVQLDPDNLDARTGLMQYYLRAPGIVGGSVAKAREQVAEVRRRNAYRGGMLAATVERREKRWAAAVAEYEKLIAQYPDSAAPWSSLASTYGDQEQWDAAFRAVDRFLAARPREILAQYAIGRAAAESGQQLDRGEQALSRYIASATPSVGEPTIATAHYRLGTIHERRGQKDKAREHYETALHLEPTLQAAREALARLK
jgi:tetratricopeptide (TPR) repeat protein